MTVRHLGPTYTGVYLLTLLQPDQLKVTSVLGIGVELSKILRGEYWGKVSLTDEIHRRFSIIEGAVARARPPKVYVYGISGKFCCINSKEDTSD